MSDTRDILAGHPPAFPRVADVSTTVLSPWVTVAARGVVSEPGGPVEEFHSLQQADYVTVLAETRAGEIVLVEQFRPALDSWTLELPGGLRNANEDPALSAVRELREETGFDAPSGLDLLGCLAPDSGRLENRLWGYHARALEPIASWEPERGVVRRIVSKKQFLRSIREGRFTMALHVALVGLAMIQGRF